MKNLLKSQSSLLLMVFVATVFQNCAPVFSELQSARTVGKNQVEFTPSYSSVKFGEDGESEGIQNHIGVQAAYGLADNIDIRVRYERLWIKDEGMENGIGVIAIGPKFSLLKDNIALYLPIGGTTSDFDTWQLHPTLLLSYPLIKDRAEITVAPKVLIPFCEDCESLVAVNISLALGNDIRKWSIRPEYGLLFNPGESGRYSHFSIGVSYRLGAGN